MRRVVRLVRSSGSPILTVAAMLAVLASALSGVPAVAQGSPPCEAAPTGPCVLQDWSGAPDGAVASPFGAVDGVVWFDDSRGDAPPAGLDIRSVGLGRVDISDPAAIRKSDDLLKLGGRKKAVTSGPHVLVRVVLDRPLSEIDAGYAGVHVATDIDRSRSNNAPAGVGTTGNPFAGMQDVYSLTYAATTGKSKLLRSDLAKRWYKAKGPFAAMWAAPNVLDIVVAPQDFGDDFRVVTFVSGADGGYDRADLGPAPIPSDGRVQDVASCIEASISTQPFTVRRLVENGQTLRDVEAPASWRGGGRFPADGAELAALGALIAAAGSADGTVALDSTVSLFEDGVVIRQRPDIILQLDGDEAQLSLELGLIRRGYNVLRDIEPQATGDPVVDAWLERATAALTEAVTPFRLARQAGPVTGDSIGDCVPELAGPSEAHEEPGPEATAESA